MNKLTNWAPRFHLGERAGNYRRGTMAISTLKDLNSCNIFGGMVGGQWGGPLACISLERLAIKYRKRKESVPCRSPDYPDSASGHPHPLGPALTIRPESQVVALWYRRFLKCGGISRGAECQALCPVRSELHPGGISAC